MINNIIIIWDRDTEHALITLQYTVETTLILSSMLLHSGLRRDCKPSTLL